MSSGCYSCSAGCYTCSAGCYSCSAGCSLTLERTLCMLYIIHNGLNYVDV